MVQCGGCHDISAARPESLEAVESVVSELARVQTGVMYNDVVAKTSLFVRKECETFRGCQPGMFFQCLPTHDFAALTSLCMFSYCPSTYVQRLPTYVFSAFTSVCMYVCMYLQLLPSVCIFSIYPCMFLKVLAAVCISRHCALGVSLESCSQVSHSI
jgi:hypothetical protein